MRRGNGLELLLPSDVVCLAMKQSLYFKEELQQENQAYALKHGFLPADTMKVNAIVSFLASMTGHPKPGDVVEVTVIYPESVKQYPNARIEKVRDGKASICLEPFVPHINEIGSAVISGGPWKSIPLDKLTYQYQVEAAFWTWGTKGHMSSGGGINFTAAVNRFVATVDCWQNQF